jgi:hypothetical protein
MGEMSVGGERFTDPSRKSVGPIWNSYTEYALGSAGPFQVMVPKKEGLPAEKALDTRHHLIQVSFR